MDVREPAAGPDRIVVRERREGDLPGCVSALRRVHVTDGYPTRWPSDPAGWLVRDRFLAAWVAVRHDAVVGHVALSHGDGDRAVALWAAREDASGAGACAVVRLFVAPQARGLGVGERLLDVACAEARRRGRRAVLDVLARDVAAVALYERLGWQLLSTEDITFGADTYPLRCYAAPDR